MIAADMLHLAARRWLILALGLAATFTLVYSSHPETVYWAKLPLNVTGPIDPVLPKTLEDTGGIQYAAATLLVRLVNGGYVEPKSSSADTTLYGEGKRRAVVARLRDVGDQWVTDVKDSVIEVQAVDASESAVLTRLAEEQGLLTSQLARLQDDLGVVPNQRIALKAPPTPTTVLEVTGSRARATVSTVIVGIVVTLALVYWSELVRRRKFVRRQVERVDLEPAGPAGRW